MFFLILAPTSSIIPIQDLAVEHRMYLPLAALTTLAIVAGYGGLTWCAGNDHLSPSLAGGLRWLAPGIVAVAAVALGVQTVARNRLYTVPVEFWAETCRSSPGFWRPHYLFSQALDAAGDLPGSLAELTATLELEPRVADVWQTRGMLWVRAGRLDLAHADLTRAIELDPQSAVAYYNRAMVELDQGRDQEALADCDRALALQPHKYLRAYLARGHIYEQLGNREQARQNYEWALRARSRLPPGGRAPPRAARERPLAGRLTAAFRAARAQKIPDTKRLGAGDFTNERSPSDENRAAAA